MSGFEALFSFYGLLLGLAIAAVAGGFGEMWRQRQRRRIGVLLPLFGLYLLFATTQQWLSLYAAQQLRISAATLIVSLAMALPYAFAAQAMFPVADDPAIDGDAFYLPNHRPLLIAVATPLLVSLGYNLIVNGLSILAEETTFVAGYVLPLAIIAALFATARRPLHIFGLLLLVACRIVRLF